MNRKISKKLVLFFLAIIVIIVTIVGWIIFTQKKVNPEPENVSTLTQGRQMHYNEINIGLANIDDNSAWVYISKQNNGEPVNKTVKVGDSFEAYGYTIEIKSVDKIANPSSMPGAGNGSIKFTINKK